jgi:hypothetical protein
LFRRNRSSCPEIYSTWGGKAWTQSRICQVNLSNHCPWQFWGCRRVTPSWRSLTHPHCS